MLHQSDCSRKVNYIYTPPQIATLQNFLYQNLLVTDNISTPTMTDHHIINWSSYVNWLQFSSESVQTLFFAGHPKNLVLGWDYCVVWWWYVMYPNCLSGQLVLVLHLPVLFILHPLFWYYSLISKLRPAFVTSSMEKLERLSIASDGKLGGAWERG